VMAVLQFEIDKKRLCGYEKFPDTQYGGSRTPFQYIFKLARAALLDTFDHGGTFVMVVDKEKITIVQRSDAEHP
jgi:hypothetical protein